MPDTEQDRELKAMGECLVILTALTEELGVEAASRVADYLATRFHDEREMAAVDEDEDDWMPENN